VWSQESGVRGLCDQDQESCKTSHTRRAGYSSACSSTFDAAVCELCINDASILQQKLLEFFIGVCMLTRKFVVSAAGASAAFLRRSVPPYFCCRMSSHAGAAPFAPDARPSLDKVSAKPVPEGFSSISEGSASIIHEIGHVFYNPAQVQNRDLSIACLNVFSKIYRQEKEIRAAKRGSRLLADASSASCSSPGVAGGNLASEEMTVEYKGLRILEGPLLHHACRCTSWNMCCLVAIHFPQDYLLPVCVPFATLKKFQI